MACQLKISVRPWQTVPKIFGVVHFKSCYLLLGLSRLSFRSCYLLSDSLGYPRASNLKFPRGKSPFQLLHLLTTASFVASVHYFEYSRHRRHAKQHQVLREPSMASSNTVCVFCNTKSGTLVSLKEFTLEKYANVLCERKEKLFKYQELSYRQVQMRFQSAFKTKYLQESTCAPPTS